MRTFPAKNAGFTLIELVMVIVILGILAAVALPKFVNLKGDADAAVASHNAGVTTTDTNNFNACKKIPGKTDAECTGN